VAPPVPALAPVNGADWQMQAHVAAVNAAAAAAAVGAAATVSAASHYNHALAAAQKPAAAAAFSATAGAAGAALLQQQIQATLAKQHELDKAHAAARAAGKRFVTHCLALPAHPSLCFRTFVCLRTISHVGRECLLHPPSTFHFSVAVAQRFGVPSLHTVPFFPV
jgi:hypothetical protein